MIIAFSGETNSGDAWIALLVIVVIMIPINYSYFPEYIRYNIEYIFAFRIIIIGVLSDPSFSLKTH